MAYPIKKLSELFLGEWNPSTTYTIGDIVDHNGSSFACIKESLNNEPPNTTYWALLANKGDKGDTGEQGIPGEQGEIGIDWQGEWTSKEYTARQAVYHNGSSYVATTTTTQEPPNTDWDLIALKGADGEGAGDVSGPEGATADNIAVFDGTTGKLIKDGGKKIADLQESLGYTAENSANKKTDLSDNSDTYYPSQKAVKTAVDAKQPLDAALTSISGLSYVSPSFIKLTAEDTYAVRTLAQTRSDIGAIAEIVEDTTPKLGGNLDADDKNIIGLGSAGFTQELDNGTKTSSFTIDFSTDQKQKVTLTENTMTLTLDTTNVKVGNYLLKIVNGGLATLTWASESGNVQWVGKTIPELTESGTDLVACYFDGTNWLLMASLNFGTPA